MTPSRITQRFIKATALIAATCGLIASAQAANIHVSSVPTQLAGSFDKDASAFVYLEGETATQGVSDTYADSRDADHSFYRTSADPSDSWGSTVAYDNARYALRGGDTGNFSDIDVYWEDVNAGLPAGQYAVFVRALPSNSDANGQSSETFTLYAGSDLASVDSGAPLGSVTTAFPGIANWNQIGTVTLGADTDTFRLSTDTNSSTVRFDTVLLAQVPEPATVTLLLAGWGGLLTMRRRREPGRK